MWFGHHVITTGCPRLVLAPEVCASEGQRLIQTKELLQLPQPVRFLPYYIPAAFETRPGNSQLLHLVY